MKIYECPECGEPGLCDAGCTIYMCEYFGKMKLIADTDELKLLKLAFTLASSEVEDRTGTCPVDQFDWLGKEDCGEVCGLVSSVECWEMYYLEKAKQILKERGSDL